MAFVHGTNTRVYWNALDLSPYLDSAALSGTSEAAETSTFGVASKTFVAGHRDRTFTSTGLYDKDLQQLPVSLAVESGVLTFCPGGASAIGDLAWMSSVVSTTYDQSAPIGGAVAFSWDAQPSGFTAMGYVLHPLAEDTNTTTGATRDDGAANAPSTTGWTAHLHVTAVDAGSWVIKLQDAGASNFSDGADLGSAAFTAATGATQQRLVSATATTSVKRYLRYVATRTGGSPGDGITFVLGFSRTYLP